MAQRPAKEQHEVNMHLPLYNNYPRVPMVAYMDNLYVPADNSNCICVHSEHPQAALFGYMNGVTKVPGVAILLRGSVGVFLEFI